MLGGRAEICPGDWQREPEVETSLVSLFSTRQAEACATYCLVTFVR